MLAVKIGVLIDQVLVAGVIHFTGDGAAAGGREEGANRACVRERIEVGRFGGMMK